MQIKNEIVGITRIQKNIHKNNIGISVLFENDDDNELQMIVLEFTQDYMTKMMTEIIAKLFDKEILISVDNFVHFLLYSDNNYEIRSFLIDPETEFSYIVNPDLKIVVVKKDEIGNVIVDGIIE